MSDRRFAVSGCMDCPMNPSSGLRHEFAKEHGYTHCTHPEAHEDIRGHWLDTYERGAPEACPLKRHSVIVHWVPPDDEVSE